MERRITEPKAQGQVRQSRDRFCACKPRLLLESWACLQMSAMSKPVDRSIQDLALLTNELHEVTDPCTLGIKLGIQSSRVQRILQDAGGTTELKVSGILDHWLKNDLNASWATLVKALKEMNHGRLSEKLAKEHCHQEGRSRYTHTVYTY